MYCKLLQSTPSNITYISDEKSEDASTAYPTMRKKDLILGEKDRKISPGDLIVMSSRDDVKVVLIVPSQKRVPEQTVAVLSSKFTPKEATERNLMILISNFNKETKYLMDCLVLAGYSHVAYLL
jgi:hypothetical protein